MFRKTFVIFTLLSLSNLCNATDKIGITQIIGHPALDRNYKGIQDTLAKNGIKKEDIEFQNAQGNPTLAAEIARRFARDRRIVVALGTSSAQAFLPFRQQKNFNVVFSSITDPLGAGLVKNLQAPEANLTGISNNVPVQKQLQFIKNVLDKSTLKVGILFNPGDSNSLSAIKETEAVANLESVTVIKAPATKLSDMLSAAQKLINEVDLIFVHNDNLALSAIRSIVTIAEKSQKPVFASDIDTVRFGVLGALGADQYELGRQTAEVVLSLLKGKNTSSIPVAYPEIVVQSVNAKQAKKLGLTLSKDLVKASLVVE